MITPWLTLAVVGVVLRRNEILLVQTYHGGDKWSLPGGHVEKGESPCGGLKREIKEELGVEIEVLNTLGMYVRLWDGDMAIAFSIKLGSSEIQKGDDVENDHFFQTSSLPRITLRTQKIFCDSTDTGRLVEMLP